MWGKQFKKAYEYLNLAIQYDPSPSANQYFVHAENFSRGFTTGKIQSDSGYDPAIDSYHKALELNKEEPGTLNSISAVYVNLQELLLLLGKYDEAIRSGEDYLSLDAEQIPDRTPARKLITRFSTVVALSLANNPRYEHELARLREEIASSDAMRYRWDFDMLEVYLEKRSPSITKDQRKIIMTLINKIKALFIR